MITLHHVKSDFPETSLSDVPFELVTNAVEEASRRRRRVDQWELDMGHEDADMINKQNGFTDPGNSRLRIIRLYKISSKKEFM